MMTTIRKSSERGSVDFGWLQSKHSFSFGSYYDPAHMGHSVLRVINDDIVSGGAGFDTHSHANMEIISYVLEGELKHKDSMGNEFTVPAGEVQRMSAGTGVSHSEFNASSSEPVKFLQIWILPAQTGTEPGYEQKAIQQAGALTALVTSDGRDDSLSINQDVGLHRLQLKKGESYELFSADRFGYLHIIAGDTELKHADQLNRLVSGDAIALKDKQSIELAAGESGLNALWFDLPNV